MTTITIEREVLDEIVELFDSAITARFPHEILRDLRAALAAPATDLAVTKNESGQIVAVTRQDEDGRIVEVLAESAPATAPATAPAQPERKPMTKEQREQVARRAEAAMNGNINLSWRDALISETEAFHDIKETP